MSEDRGKAKILIVDDEERNLKLLGVIISKLRLCL